MPLYLQGARQAEARLSLILATLDSERCPRLGKSYLSRGIVPLLSSSSLRFW
jgi:hypothetical protein